MAKKQDQSAEEVKPSRDEQLITILEKLSRHEVGVDVDIAALKADILPKPSESTGDEQTA